VKNFAKKVMGLLKTEKIDYGDVRIVFSKTETIKVKNEETKTASYSESNGFGVRVIVNGAWGFASSSILQKRK